MSWLWRPGVLGLFAVILASLVYPFLKRTWQRSESERQPSTPGAVSQGERGSFWWSWGAVFTGGIVTVLAWALWMSQGFEVRAGLFPWAIGVPVLALAIVQLVLDLHSQGSDGGRADAAEGEAELPPHVI
jgi:ABC-type Fe3+ transport system permease subunit